ncbi:unnamed protein product [Mytilus coruscus]|uniref:Uncharacterized protein n=1 Tax=Mytilus coruscus TaxID=42192 RepID=A0A6J8AW07_MYTCO|nr:unnamed protein product [Mytilus coruscus]
MIKNKSTLNGIRNAAVFKSEWKDAFETSIQPVIELVNGRFGRMKLKGTPLSVYRGVPHELFGQPLDDYHRPSSRNTTDFDTEEVELDKTNRELLKAGRARDAILCGECNKPRKGYSANRLIDEQDEVLRRIKEQKSYVCGDSLPEGWEMVMISSLLCTSEVETSYYGSTVRSFLPPCCVYCGTKGDFLESSDDYISELFTHFSVVRPICTHCRSKGHGAKIWGRQFVRKKKKS